MSLQFTTCRLVRLEPTEENISLRGSPSREKLCVGSREEFLQGQELKLPCLLMTYRRKLLNVKATGPGTYFKVSVLIEEARGFIQVWIALRNSRWCVFSLSQKSTRISCRVGCSSLMLLASHNW